MFKESKADGLAGDCDGNGEKLGVKSERELGARLCVFCSPLKGLVCSDGSKESLEDFEQRSDMICLMFSKDEHAGYTEAGKP